ncbi:UDP-glycosyltransferase UGT5-like isoform X7 [Planococcus citri]|uniref:UDP-glycosyltransferase UGT5-like isoform X7 n=1 Tax=Planococcus citri TaxID=170843 RepID=UPI0031F7247D
MKCDVVTLTVIFFILSNYCNDVASSYKILAVFPFPSKSHYAIPDPLLMRLVELGHEVTVYTHYPKKENNIPNYKDIDIGHCFPALTPLLTMDSSATLGSSLFLRLYVTFFTDLFTTLDECEPLIELLNSTEKYDVFLTEAFATDAMLMYAWKFNIPAITVVPNVMLPWLSSRMGNPHNPAYVTNYMLSDYYWKEMSFLEKTKNTILYGLSLGLYKYGTSRNDDVVIHKQLESAPSVEELIRNVSLLFVSSNSVINAPIPLVPAVVDIGGIHIKPSRRVPENIEKFINESKHGVVYFCMGSLLRGETFPPEKREAFLYAFSKIPQRVLWKWEGDVLPGKSDNIMISKWMPQRDILAHPNVKLFISHGGLLGTSEAVYEGVPVLGIPIFGDQRTNIKSLEANGAGELLDYNEISKEVVLEKIQRLLNDPKYKENAKLLSDRYRDRPMSPLDTAVYWTEYVIRHKGAPHLRTAAADMPWYQYLLLDVIAFIVAVLVAGLLIIYYTTKFILRAIYGLICGGGAKKGSSKSDKKKRN